MNRLCDFSTPDRTCPTCGYVAKSLPTFRVCQPVPEKAWQPIQVGDIVERWLTAVGITKEFVEKWTRTEGKPGGCGCEGRKRWLNEWGNSVQYAVRRFGDRVRRFYFGI